jgi:putative acetyltransferase
MVIRPPTPADYPAIAELVTAAFLIADHASGTEADIVERARAEGSVLVELVMEDDGEIVGHVLYSRMTTDRPLFAAALGPVAAIPGRQSQGIGSLLVRRGLDDCRTMGVEAVIVLGHPPYYPRFGFSAQDAAKITSPYAGRPSFMAMALKPGALDAPLKADYPAAFGS